MSQANQGGGVDFVICPHCWHLNPPARICAGCFADMTTRLQETGGKRWTAPAQSPMPVRGRLSQRQRVLLLGALVLFAASQLALALAPVWSQRPAPPIREAGGPTTED